MDATLTATPSVGGTDQLFADTQKTAVDRLGTALDAVLRQADDYLFDRSAQAAEGTELTALRDLRRARPELRRAFDASVVSAFHRLRRGAMPAEVVKQELRLLSEDDLEEQLACEQMVENLVRKHAASLELLDQRMAMLAERSALAAGDNPVGPAALAHAMRDALRTAELSTSVRIALYKFAERELATALTSLYNAINARLADAGILPRLLPSTPLVDREAQPARDEVPVERPAAATEGPSDHALFSSLVGMLQSWRQHVMPTAADARPTSAPLAMPQLMSALSLLQTDPPAAFEQALGDSRASLADLLRREVLSGARRLGMGGEDLNLSSVQEDAVDLVGMLFDVLLDERDFEPDVRRKISRMLVPYVKVAAQDRRMFVYKGHPARRFLNAVAEACEGNHGDAPQDRELLDRVDAAIERLVAEFNEDVAIFETLEQELRAFMAQQRQRIEIAERRAAETQRGRERLEAARERAVADVAARRGEHVLPDVLETLLSGYATHHLTQLGLRGGPDAEPYVEALRTLDGVIHAHDAAKEGVAPPEWSELHRVGLARILGSSGCVGDVAEEAIETLQRSLHQLATGAAVADAGQLPAPVVQHAEAPPPALELVGGSATLDFDPDMAEQMRALAVGTWVQLVGESGRGEPAKVSWISPISNRLLFVNRRGGRILVASAEELAAMEKLGRIQLRPAGAAFDAAMQQMVGRLQTKVAA